MAMETIGAAMAAMTMTAMVVAMAVATVAMAAMAMAVVLVDPLRATGARAGILLAKLCFFGPKKIFTGWKQIEHGKETNITNILEFSKRPFFFV